MTWVFCLLALCGGTSQDEAPTAERSTAPLLEHKRALMGDPRPYVHLTPDAIMVHFKQVDLKRIPVVELRGSPQTDLRRSRVRTWSPFPARPTLLADDVSIDDVDPLGLILRVDDMPETFVVWLEDDTLMAVTSSSRHRNAGEVLGRLLRDDPRHLESAPETWLRSLLVRLEPRPAREFYWLLQEGMGVIY